MNTFTLKDWELCKSSTFNTVHGELSPGKLPPKRFPPYPNPNANPNRNPGGNLLGQSSGGGEGQLYGKEGRGGGAIFRSRFNKVLFKQKLMQLVITGNQ